MEAPDDGSVPDFVVSRDHLIDELVAFTRALRRRGVQVPANAGITAGQALATIGFDDECRARVALRSVLVSREEDITVFERLFPDFWRRLRVGLDEGGYGDEVETDRAGVGETAQDLIPPDDAGAPDQEPGGDEDGSADDREASDLGAERMRNRRVANARDEEHAETDADAEETETAVYSPTGSPSLVDVQDPDLVSGRDDLAPAIDRLTRAVASLRGRRWGRSGDRRMHIRQALRRSFGTGGTVMDVPQHSRKETDVDAVLLVDVSQSVLDNIDRGFLVRFLWQVHERWRSVRIFFFDTEIREVTRQFDAPTVDGALRALRRAEAEWGGGTRIGNAIDAVRSGEPTLVDRDTIVFVISDGLEVGELDLLESGASWLSRRAAAVLWLNPLAASPDYEPTCQGMDVSMPYIDAIFAFTGTDDVTEMARQIQQHGLYGHIGYEYDPRRLRMSVD